MKNTSLNIYSNNMSLFLNTNQVLIKYKIASINTRIFKFLKSIQTNIA